MDNSVCALARSSQNSDDVRKLQCEVKLGSSILNEISDKFWSATQQDIIAYISQTEAQFTQFKILKVKADEIQKHFWLL